MISKVTDLLSRHRDLVAVAIIILAAVIFFAPFLFGGKIFLAGDSLYSFLPWQSYSGPNFRPYNPLITDPINHNYAEIYNRQLKEGHLSRWSPYFYTGLPATGITAQNGVTGRHYPLKLLLHRIFKTYVAHDLLLFLHVILMGLSMYLFLGEIGAGMQGALFGAVAYMFNGCAMVWLEFETVVAAYAFFPLALYCMERFLLPSRYFYAFAAAAVVGIMSLMGHIQFLIYTFLLLGFYLLFLVYRVLQEKRGMRELGATLSCFAILCLGSGLIAALDMIPIAELIRTSSRISRDFSFGTFFDQLGRVPFRYYVTMLFPDYFGSPVLRFNIVPALPTQEYMNYCELTLFAGIPTLFAFLGLLAAPRTKHGGFFLFMTVLMVLLLSGTVVYYPFFKLVPGMNKMNPTRMIFLFNLIFAVAAGLGIRSIQEFSRRQRAVFLSLSLALEGLILYLAVASTNPRLIAWFNAELVRDMNSFPPRLISILTKLRDVSSPIIMVPLVVSLVTLALVTTMVFAGRRKVLGAGAFCLLVALLGWQLINFGRTYNTVVESKYIYPKTPAIDFLLRQPKPFRVVQHGMSGFGVNTLGPFGIEEVGGYSSFYPKRFNKLASYIEMGADAFKGRGLDRWVIINNLDSPILNIVNAKYFLVAPGLPLSNPDLKLVYRGEIDIYENTAALPRAYVVHSTLTIPDEDQAIALLGSRSFNYSQTIILDRPLSPNLPGKSNPSSEASRVNISSYGNDDIVLTAEMADEGLVVLSDPYYPGWVATVDGREAPILRANVHYRAVRVPQGHHEISFVYRPASFRWGARSALLGIIFIIAGMVWFNPMRPPDTRKKLWRRQTDPLPPATPLQAPHSPTRVTAKRRLRGNRSRQP